MYPLQEVHKMRAECGCLWGGCGRGFHAVLEMFHVTEARFCIKWL